MVDRDRVVHSKSFRRLKHKTQVFIAPRGDHYRSRLTHTLEVNQIAKTIGAGLNLNIDLIEAIALAHDVGHTPFAHAGEEVLNQLLPGVFAIMKTASGFLPGWNSTAWDRVSICPPRYWTGCCITVDTEQRVRWLRPQKAGLSA